ncbi:hypothetical protein [Nocardia carnea]|uniref:GyrI-like small molecule binding domain-containing protein n=1 Tax=Nocardia carnea TaxID=37328 RepID=A0ABW7TRC3_9NOCA|nr:hypothetical protein [Nocardia carnea]
MLTDNAEFRPMIDVYYALGNDVEVAGPVPAGSNIVYHASQAHPAGTGRAGTAHLLKKFADETVGCLGDATIETVVFNPPIDDGDVDRSMTVYYTTSE